MPKHPCSYDDVIDELEQIVNEKLLLLFYHTPQ